VIGQPEWQSLSVVTPEGRKLPIREGPGSQQQQQQFQVVTRIMAMFVPTVHDLSVGRAAADGYSSVFGNGPKLCDLYIQIAINFACFGLLFYLF
jgi:hypothetical protein